MIHYQIRKIHIVFEEIAYIYNINFSHEIEKVKFNNLKKAINIFGRIDTLKWFLAYLIDYKISNFDCNILADSEENNVKKLLECLELGKKYEWFVKYNADLFLTENYPEHPVLAYDNKISEEDYRSLSLKRLNFASEKLFSEYLVKNYKKEVIQSYYENRFLEGERINCSYLFRIRNFFRKKFEGYDIKKLLSRINKIKFDIQLLDKIKFEWIIELEIILKTRFEMKPNDYCYKDYILQYINQFQKSSKKNKKDILMRNFANLK